MNSIKTRFAKTREVDTTVFASALERLPETMQMVHWIQVGVATKEPDHDLDF